MQKKQKHTRGGRPTRESLPEWRVDRCEECGFCLRPGKKELKRHLDASTGCGARSFGR